MKIIHHNDLDGYVAGDIIKTKYPNAKCYSVNYDNPELLPKKEDFKENEIVFMVDYTIEDKDLMNWLKDHTRLYWIDHHKSSLEKEKSNHWENIKGLRKIGLCGAELCWKIFYPDDVMPKFIRFVGNYDIFRYVDKPIHEKMVIPFAFGAMTYMDKMKPENYNHDDFLFKTKDDFYKSWTNKFIKDGEIIYKYKKVQGEIENPCNCFVKELWSYRVLCMNSCGRGSDQFTIPGTWNPDLHDIMLIFYYNGNKWAYGLYTEKKNIDVSKIAMQYGGGGHAGASGFCIDYLLNELTE